MCPKSRVSKTHINLETPFPVTMLSIEGTKLVDYGRTTLQFTCRPTRFQTSPRPSL